MDSETPERDAQGRTESGRQMYRRKGFDPDLEIHEFYGCFMFEEAQQSLFGSTRLKAIPVYLTDEHDGTRLPVVLDLARPLYIQEDIGDSEAPNWYFEGWILKTGFDTTQGFERVRIHVSTLDPFNFTEDDIFTWQRIKS